MQIQRIDLDQPGDLLTGLHATYLAASGDDPGPLVPTRAFAWLVRTGGPGRRAEAWAASENGEVVGGYGLAFPQSENTHLGRLFPLVVRPERRGRGLGSALLRHAVDRVRAEGRRLLLAESPATGTGERFARAQGMTVAVAEARRVLDLRSADWTAFERMLPQVDGYRLDRWTGPAAPELYTDLAALMAGMNDAPRDGDVEALDYDVERVRLREESLALTGDDCYTVIARRASDGAPAGYTRIRLLADRSSDWGHQEDTTVLAEHRGRRLGLLLKLANLLWLREREPGIGRIITWNATSNAHMLAINEALGFRVLDEWNEWRLPVGPRR
ncbi:GNAT family N-acetyltransferase [Nonomuraea sp. NPDC005983]|uniref:GNAT family N-acetyltransferase n=1 Tax=Nonomuraea sp. NPDC005983 TaxID=3155595 RepID=UPI0033BC606F